MKEPLRSLASGKALGQGGFPAEILKCRKGDAFTKFCEIVCLCWMEGEVPQDMRDVNIVIPFKSEGDRGECNNYRGISLLSITKKTLWSRRLEDFPSVCSAKFIQGHICFPCQKIHNWYDILHQMTTRKNVENRDSHWTLSDLIKAFDLISRDGLFKNPPENWLPTETPRYKALWFMMAPLLIPSTYEVEWSMGVVAPTFACYRWCSNYYTLWGWATKTHQSLQRCLQGLRSSYQRLGQDVTSPPDIKIFDQQLEVVHDLIDLRSSIRQTVSHSDLTR